jgi:catechol 2,3-dioxygenase-like lactoylglutathione lyase family enzyme
MSGLRIGSIVIRVDDLDRQVEFWSKALHYVPRGEPTHDWVSLRPADDLGPNISLDRHDSEAKIPPRIHLDLYTNDQRAEVERLLELGATLIDWPRPPGADFITLEDPEGNRFDVVQLPPDS